MRLYGLQGVKGLVGNPAMPRTIVERGLAPKKRDGGPPVGGYFAWWQAMDRSDLVFDGENVVGWRGRGNGGAMLAAPDASTQYANYLSPGLTFQNSTSKLNGGAFGDTRTVFVVFGAGGTGSMPQYAGLLTREQDVISSDFVFTRTSTTELSAGWGFGGTGRLNGGQPSQPIPYVQDGTLNVVSATRDSEGALPGKIQVGNDRTNSGRQWRGSICEVLLYERILPEGERSAVERWLAARWGILSKFP